MFIRVGEASLPPSATSTDRRGSQTITRRQNAFLYDTLQAFQAQTSLPVLLNTSFNGKDEPIVETLEDALRAFCRLGSIA